MSPLPSGHCHTLRGRRVPHEHPATQRQFLPLQGSPTNCSWGWNTYVCCMPSEAIWTQASNWIKALCEHIYIENVIAYRPQGFQHS